MVLRPQLPSCKDSSFRKTWNPKYTLRSHFDGVRALAFHPVEPCLVTVSEDHTLKLWNLTKTVPAKKYGNWTHPGRSRLVVSPFSTRSDPFSLLQKCLV